MYVASKGSEGFTLMELSVALLVFLIGVLGVLQLLVLGISINQRSRDTTLTTSLAQGKVDELLRRNFTSLSIDTMLARGGIIPTSSGTNPLISPNPTPLTGFVDYFDYNGNCVPSCGSFPATPPANTYFVRQWQICDGCLTSPPVLCSVAGCTPASENAVKKITVTVTALSPIFRGSFPSTTLVVYKSRIN
ncbi:MAG: prepilin-type N-terminal cleavage/methylation domain-containing protein [Acidobacteriota bacterium]